jgi:ADP-heptose:LPS heptosyltransferase
MVKLYRLADILQRWRAKSRPRPDAPNGLLLLSCGGLGDTVLLSHVIEEFCKYATENEPVTILLRKDGAKTAFLFPGHIKTYVVDFPLYHKNLSSRSKISNQLYDANYRAVISTDYLRHPDLDEAMMRATGAPEIIAMQARPWGKYQAQLAKNAQFFSRLFDSGPALQDKVLRWYKFANWLSGEATTPRLKLSSPSTQQKVEPPLVLIQPFSAVKAKQCGPDVYQALFDALPADTDIRITGAPDEMDKNPSYAHLLERANVSFEDAGFVELAGLLKAARLVVSVDTAVMHLSVAVGAPTLCLASAAYVGEIVPYAINLIPSNVEFYYKSMTCKGCLGKCINSLQNGSFKCIDELDSPTVVSKALRLLTRSDPTGLGP